MHIHLCKTAHIIRILHFGNVPSLIPTHVRQDSPNRWSANFFQFLIFFSIDCIALEKQEQRCLLPARLFRYMTGFPSHFYLVGRYPGMTQTNIEAGRLTDHQSKVYHLSPFFIRLYLSVLLPKLLPSSSTTKLIF